MNKFDRYFPWVILGVVALYLVKEAIPPSSKAGDPNIAEVRSLPVLDGGRMKPLDTLARVSLMSISNRSEFEDNQDKTKPAIAWLLDVMSSPDEVSSPAADYKVFRIENDQIISFLNLKMRKGLRYSLREILGDREQYAKLRKEFDRISEMDTKKFTLFDAKMAELSKKVNLYVSLAQKRLPLGVAPQVEGGEWQSISQIDRKITAPYEAIARQKTEEEVLKPLFEQGVAIDRLTDEDKESIRSEINLRTHRKLAELADEIRAEKNPAAAAYLRIFQMHRLGGATGFNEALTDYEREYLKHVPESDLWRAKLETWFNHFAPFYHCIGLFVVVFILSCCSWLGWSEPLNKAASWLMVLTLSLHTSSILVRMYLQGRPPVTNLYSSAIFIGWGAVCVSILLERWHRNGIGNVAGSVLGFMTMIIAHHLGTSGDSLEMMQAVLDTNFWLATHVTCVTLGYTATFVTGVIGIVYIFWGLFFSTMEPAKAKKVSQMLYGVLCFATLLSFVGTVLGGIWADQSWGRFWGWDPKENGAVLIVLWNALILHARWSGLVRQRGVAVLALVGNMITFWSWFGTNQLGVGLHAYGFSKELVLWCRYWWLAHLALIGIGLLPLKYWRSFCDDTIKDRAAAARRDEQVKKQIEKNRPKVETAQG